MKIYLLETEDATRRYFQDRDRAEFAARAWAREFAKDYNTTPERLVHECTRIYEIEVES